MSGRPFAALIILAGTSPFIALSFLSLAHSSVWGSWSESVSKLSQESPLWRVDIAILEISMSWVLLAVAGGLLLSLALVSRSSLLSVLVVAAPIAAQLPGIVSHTQFQWAGTFADRLTIAQEPGIAVVGLALAAVPVGIFGLGTAAALEQVRKSLVAGNAEPEGTLSVLRGNTLLLLGVLVFSLAVGAVTLIPLTGIPGSFTDYIAGNAAVITWTSVAACALVFGAAYSFFHRRWWARSDAADKGETLGVGSNPD